MRVEIADVGGDFGFLADESGLVDELLWDGRLDHVAGLLRAAR